MCSPVYIDIVEEINPHMHKEDKPDVTAAERQWGALVKEYITLGIYPWFIQPKPRMQDMCFTANAGWCRWGKVTLANFRYAARRAEHYYYDTWFREYREERQLDVEIVSLPEEVSFEGQGDVVTIDSDALSEPLVLMGYGFRTDHEAAEQLRRIHRFHADQFIPLRLVNKWFYHLDTCCFYIPAANVLMYYPGAFDAAGRRVIKGLPCDLLPVTKEEAFRFVCNAVFIGRSIVINQPGDRICKELEQRNLRVVKVDTSEFIKSGGSARCLTLFLPAEAPRGNRGKKSE